MQSQKTTYRIAHSEASLGWGGQEIRVLGEMQAMRERGHELSLFAPEESRISKNALDAGFTVVPLNAAKLRYPLTILQLASELKKRGIQVVNTHSSKDGWLLGIASRLAGVKLLIRSRHIDVDYPNRLVSRIAFQKLPHRVLTTSEKIREKLMRELRVAPEKVQCVPTGIDPERYTPSIPGVLHQELKLDPTVPLIGVVAVLRSWKGHLGFLEAARKLHDTNPAPQFVLAGDGPMRKKIEQKIRDLGLNGCLHLLGHRADVPQVIASLSLVVLPSYAHEGIPQVMLQAQAMGKPVIGTTAGGIPEVVLHEETGLLVPPNDPPALASAMAKILSDSNLARRLGEAGRKRVMTRHSVEHMCETLEKLYAAC